MATPVLFSDLINKVQLRLNPTARDIVVSLNGNVIAGATSLPFTDLSQGSIATQAIQIGALLSIDLEVFVVTGAVAAGAIPVSPGYRGSTPAAHTSGALIHINSQFTDFQVAQAINDDLDDLCSTENGLYNIAMCEVTASMVYQAYDLTDINSGLAVTNLKDIIAIRYKTPFPDRKYIGIPDTEWELIPANPNDANFPSGYMLTINGTNGFPGQPMNVIYKQGFTHLVNYTDNVQSVALLPLTCNDLPPLGAMCILVPPREVRRNDPGSQPDSRLAPEVPPGAIEASIKGVMMQRQMRITAEAANLKTTAGLYRRRF